MPARPKPPSKPAADAFDPALLARVNGAHDVLALFDHTPRIYAYAKDRQSRFVWVNAGLIALLGASSPEELLGRDDFAFAPPALAAQYIEEDRQVFRSGEALLRRAWLVAGADGLPRWFLSTKLPLFDARRAVIGLAGVMHPLESAGDAPGKYRRLTPAIDYVLAHYGEPIPLEKLASTAHLSISQLRREFQRLFGLTPGEYLLKVRLLASRRKLEQTDAAVGEIALDCGFYDQSHFTRSFRKETGLTPLEYRRRFAAVRPERECTIAKGAME